MQYSKQSKSLHIWLVFICSVLCTYIDYICGYLLFCDFCSDLSLKQKSSTTTTSSGDIISKHQLAFKKCSAEVKNNLDVPEIIPHLISQGLLTERDCQILLSNHTTNTEKVHYLLDVLPRKERFFTKFLHCLYQMKSGTAHGDIAMALSLIYTNTKDMQRNSQTTTLFSSSAYTSPNIEVASQLCVK